jgi:cholesterol 7-desaturase
MTLRHAIRIFNKIEVCSLGITAQQIGPGYVPLLMNTSFGPMICLQTVTPEEPLVQRVVHRFYGPRSIAWFAKFTLWGETIMVSLLFTKHSSKFCNQTIFDSFNAT